MTGGPSCDPRELFALGFAHFEAGRWFEAHEEWEKIWLACRGERDAPLLQGLIQIAAVRWLLDRGRVAPARRLLASALAKIGDARELRGIPLEPYRSWGRATLERLEGAAGAGD